MLRGQLVCPHCRPDLDRLAFEVLHRQALRLLPLLRQIRYGAAALHHAAHPPPRRAGRPRGRPGVHDGLHLKPGLEGDLPPLGGRAPRRGGGDPDRTRSNARGTSMRPLAPSSSASTRSTSKRRSPREAYDRLRAKYRGRVRPGRAPRWRRLAWPIMTRISGNGSNSPRSSSRTSAGSGASSAPDSKAEMARSIFPEKWIYDGERVRTREENPLIALFSGKMAEKEKPRSSDDDRGPIGLPGQDLVRTLHPSLERVYGLRGLVNR